MSRSISRLAFAGAGVGARVEIQMHAVLHDLVVSCAGNGERFPTAVEPAAGSATSVSMSSQPTSSPASSAPATTAGLPSGNVT
jgi:hypothetical protein